MTISKLLLMRFSVYGLVVFAFASLGFNIKAQTNGIDLSFNTTAEKDPTGSPGLAVQRDGKIIIFGDFQVVNGIINNRIARFNEDGT